MATDAVLYSPAALMAGGPAGCLQVVTLGAQINDWCFQKRRRLRRVAIMTGEASFIERSVWAFFVQAILQGLVTPQADLA